LACHPDGPDASESEFSVRRNNRQP
jgi:hypothetical protein